MGAKRGQGKKFKGFDVYGDITEMTLMNWELYRESTEGVILDRCTMRYRLEHGWDELSATGAYAGESPDQYFERISSRRLNPYTGFEQFLYKIPAPTIWHAQAKKH